MHFLFNTVSYVGFIYPEIQREIMESIQYLHADPRRVMLISLFYTYLH